jgi:hypothetical protein
MIDCFPADGPSGKKWGQLGGNKVHNKWKISQLKNYE